MMGLLLHNGDKGEHMWDPSYPSGYLLVLPRSTDQVHAATQAWRGFSSVQSLSRVWLCNPMNHSTPGFPVHHQLPEFTQTHVHWVGDAIQPSHPLTSPSSPAPNTPQHQGLFKWVNPSHEVAKVLKFQLQHQSFQWTPRTNLLYDGMLWSPCNPKDSQESSPTPQFKSINSSVLSFLHSPTLTLIHGHWKNHIHSSNLQILRNKVWVTTPCR